MNVQQLAQRLVQFESTHEKPKMMQHCLNFCVDFFQDTSARITRYESEGHESVLIANADGIDFDVLLLGHIDTVPGAQELFEGKIESGNLHGRGSLDMKAFVATSMCVLRDMLIQGSDKKVGLIIVTDEELGGQYGARYLVEDVGVTSQVVLVPDDGEDLSVIVANTKQVFQVRFNARGKESHACRPWDGINAIELLQSVAKNLQAQFDLPTSEPDDMFIDTYNIGLIAGGTASNEVPDRAEMTVDMRFADPKTREEFDLIVQQVLVPGVEYVVEQEGAPTVTSPEDPMVKSYVQAIKHNTGLDVVFGTSGGATDARYFAAAGMTTIVHQGGGGRAQSDDEHVNVSDLKTLVKIQTQFVRDL